ncbi:phage tail protein [Escherichia coli]|uniref:phage tail protein n=4 Tax=Escherichia coli TaxID=562 RepID=UPI001F1A850C|nr:phage tail protein [Escherichia coli]MCG0608806.1 phage tail protein [Escherichia coli]
MTVKYYAILTNQGAARLANATMLGSKLNLTQMAVGDANGVLPTPDPAQTKLINQKRIAPLNMLSVDPDNQSQIIAEQIIPENEGGFWIREIGLYDDEGVLIAVANCPETYKPQLQEGSGRTQTIRMILVVTNTEAITLKIDPSVVLSTRKYVDDKVIEVKGYASELMKGHLNNANPHNQYPLITNALNEMVNAGLVSKVLENLGLGEGSALPVGVPVPWPTATPPAGWLQCNGASFTREQYPVLARVYPNLRLPDLRGEFIRGWDDGREVDVGRLLLNAQPHSVMDHIHYMELWTGEGLAANSTRAGTNPGILATYGDGGIVKTDESGVKVPSSLRAIGTRGVYRLGANGGNIGTETRPRNVAFNYIVRAV